MKFKLDENIGNRGLDLLQKAGFDVSTVKRALITLDLDFGNPLLFNPKKYFGIIVLRLPKKPSLEDLLDLIQLLVREYQPDN